ncbi:MAG: HAMP domain-containing sensor histidine kinase [bacterium]
MFERARVKLTGWYLLIIMMISFSFSGVIYRSATFELQRFAQAQQNKFERRMMPIQPENFSVVIDDELIIEAEQRILNALIFINIIILLVSAGLGYYLSGKTLAPIQEMMDDQYRFVSDASHELKTPITAIKTTLEVALRDKQLNLKESRETLSTSLEEVERLQKLAEGLLELTHKKMVGAFVPINLAGVIKTTTKMIQPIAEKKKIKITTKIPETIVMADESSLSRALLAIIDNAIKYSKSGSEIKIGSKTKERLIKINIADQGVGIEKENIKHVFDRFYRTDPARSMTGYGLGLSIAKQIIEEHGGTIEMTSTLGKGSTVIISLPYSAKLQNTTR